MGDIKFVTLVSGQTYLCKCQEVTDEDGKKKLVLSNPTILRAYEQEGQTQIVCVASNPFSDDESVTVSKEHVLFIETPNEETYNEYNRHFGSGIELANSLPAT